MLYYWRCVGDLGRLTRTFYSVLTSYCAVPADIGCLVSPIVTAGCGNDMSDQTNSPTKTGEWVLDMLSESWRIKTLRVHSC
jgi:hypothetical protein